MRVLLRDAEDQTRIAFEVEEAIYDPEQQKIFLYSASGTCYAIDRVVTANADSLLEALAAKGYPRTPHVADEFGELRIPSIRL